ncbi:HD-GYP domain-containing protein [Novipirellula artificiosorum]|uniref:Cyclic di-GMP phosphodiesterase response regulator RpfG n=1 Tax=Novipirellula artificiosorum TaxID=2528016 RepID=A0A5C6DE12_9BACT|nr:HD domain-containing phosphohydrolase [Novipirellula artificiosorum]TWU34992.1 Cyclic di-GMP phosphodiesterase response regulator RpfG [Novipirellula artificiosorum]
MSKFCRVSIDTLVVGARLQAAIPDPDNPRVKLLTEGTEVTEDFLRHLQTRDIRSLFLSEKDVAVLASFQPQGRSTTVPAAHSYVCSHAINEHTLLLDQCIENLSPSTVNANEIAFASSVCKLEDCPYDHDMTIAWAAESGESIGAIGDVFSEAIRSPQKSASPMHKACHDILRRMMEDVDALVCLACSPHESEYPARHSYHLAALAMAIGAQMALDQATLIDLGIGCMIHDIGMKAVGTGLFGNDQPLTRGQLKLLADHPVRGADVIGKFGEQVSLDSRMVAYQIHERCDGSGYPRGRSADEIHPLAKIASVADAFIGMVSNRPHRPAIQGYHAVVAILDEMKKQRFDPKVVRSLLELTSLHPLGSLVQLSNGCVGRTIRATSAAFDKPTIEMWSSPSRTGPPQVVNLVQDSSIQIVRAQAGLDAA